MFNYENKEHIECPFTDVRYFIQEKYKIAGDKPGSGNTENIGSFSTKSFEALKNGTGPFAYYGKEVFDLYWKYYPKYRASTKDYTSLPEFLRWFVNQPQENVTLLYEYDYEKVKDKIQSSL